MLSSARASAVFAALSVVSLSLAVPVAAQRPAVASSDTTLRVDERAVAAALASPEALWAFVTAPETRWADRTAATWRAFPQAYRSSPEGFFGLMESAGLDLYGRAPAPPRFVLPMDFFPRVVAARRELARERAIHNWGLRRRANPNSRAATFERPFRYQGERRRVVLGHVWMVPDGGSGYEPTTPSGRRFGPWPAQVEGALDVLYEGFFADTTRAAEFFTAALRMPCVTHDDAESLFRETNRFAGQARTVTPEVVGAWRNAALRTDLPRMASWVSQGFYTIGITKSDEAFWLGQAFFADMAAEARDEEVHMLAMHLDWLDSDTRPGWDIVRPAPPHTAIYAIARRVNSLPETVEPYQRYDAAKDVLQMADTAAFAAFPQVQQTDSIGNEEAIAQYRAWYQREHHRLAYGAVTQRARVDAARQSLQASRVCKHPSDEES